MSSVLVVEDEPLIRWMLTDLLTDAGFAVREAKDGAEAEAAFPGGFDVVLLDIRLPDADGLELLVRWKAARPATRVVMMTGHGTPEVQRRATAGGADGFVHKPFEMEALLAQVRALSSGA